MPIFRPTPAMLHLSNYWNALNHNAPPDELARLAALVDPADIATIERAVALHAWRMPDPAFATRLETTLMNAYPTTVQVTVPLVTAQQPASNGRFAPNPARPIARHWPQSRRWSFSSVLGVALVILLIVTSLGGIWLFNQRSNDTHILAPPDATPTTEASPDVPMYRGNAARTGVMPGPSILGTPVELWSVQLGGSINSAPAIVDGVLFLGVGDGGVYAFDTTTGETIWQFAGASSISSSPAVADGLVYVGSDDGTLYALNAAGGSEAWTFPGTRSAASVVVENGVVYTGSDDGFLYAIDAVTGEERWSSALGESASRSPAVADGIVYMGSADGVLHAVDAVSGEERWTFQTEGGGLVATTAIGDGILIQSTFDGNDNFVYGLNPDTGEQVWQFTLGSSDGYLPPAIGEDLVFVPSHDANLYALDLATGEQVWSFATGAPLTAAPALVGDTLYLGGHDGFLYTLDAATGVELWRYAIGGEVDFGPVVTGGVLYTGTTFGNLYAITGSGSLGAMSDPEATPEVSPVAVEASPVTMGDLATFLWATTGGDPALAQPTSIEIAPDGNVWVTNGEHSQFGIFTPEGSFIESWGVFGAGDGEFDFITQRDGDAFGGVAFAPDGSFYVVEAGNRRVQHFAADRTFLHAWGGFGAEDGEFIEPFDIAVDAEGNVFVSDMARDDVQKFTPDGTFLLKFGGSGTEPGQLDWQGWMTIAPDGTVWVVDGRNPRIQQWASDGTFLQAIDTSEIVVDPYGIGVDANGRLFLTDLGGARIVVLDATGNVIGQWGERGEEDGQFLAPVHLHLAGDAIYITDIDAGTIQKFQLQPPLTGEPAATPAAVATPDA